MTDLTDPGDDTEDDSTDRIGWDALALRNDHPEVARALSDLNNYAGDIATLEDAVDEGGDAESDPLPGDDDVAGHYRATLRTLADALRSALLTNPGGTNGGPTDYTKQRNLIKTVAREALEGITHPPKNALESIRNLARDETTVYVVVEEHTDKHHSTVRRICGDEKTAEAYVDANVGVFNIEEHTITTPTDADFPVQTDRTPDRNKR